MQPESSLPHSPTITHDIKTLKTAFLINMKLKQAKVYTWNYAAHKNV